MTKKYIGVDLHTNSFTICVKEEGKKDIIKTYSLSEKSLNSFKTLLTKETQVSVEATGNSNYFKSEIEGLVSKVVIVSPYHFGVIRKSVKKTDKHDARALSYYLSKGMLPEAHSKSVKKREINSLIGLRRKLVESRSKLILKVHSLFVRNGKKVYRDKFSTMFSFKKLTSSIKWSELESYELEVIEKQLELLYTQIAKLDGKIEEESKRLLGYNNLVSIKGIGSFTAGLILSNISDI